MQTVTVQAGWTVVILNASGETQTTADSVPATVTLSNAKAEHLKRLGAVA